MLHSSASKLDLVNSYEVHVRYVESNFPFHLRLQFRLISPKPHIPFFALYLNRQEFQKLRHCLSIARLEVAVRSTIAHENSSSVAETVNLVSTGTREPVRRFPLFSLSLHPRELSRLRRSRTCEARQMGRNPRFRGINEGSSILWPPSLV